MKCHINYLTLNQMHIRETAQLEDLISVQFVIGLIKCLPIPFCQADRNEPYKTD